ncbi:hypothetical protein L211DRAFT_344290 [Terfezia boudieri ATCC MYA-4762]|uniref:Uncharacterized protein n=1 Tax=Terfezia boudieri ATCC MYA-4762 TaxID=1051890 RepID=A0A3N4LHC1_9PEZI|nr:hypothetical protein L211DRAFT_344290 [Terfezia boudieri ATCC MYA-4762]
MVAKSESSIRLSFIAFSIACGGPFKHYLFPLHVDLYNVNNLAIAGFDSGENWRNFIYAHIGMAFMACVLVVLLNGQ